jgi:small subunit ribosomal protein S20
LFAAGKTTASSTATAEDVIAVEALVNEAYTEIDKAVIKGILHKNNAAHKKSRVAKYKRAVAMAAGAQLSSFAAVSEASACLPA